MMEPEEVQRYERHMRSLARAIDDPEALAQVLALREAFLSELDARIADAVAQLRSEGFSWREIAAPLPISHQAAHLKWG